MKTRGTNGKIDFCLFIMTLILMASQAVFGGDLKIAPVDDFEPSGPSGGPFSPSSKEYELTNQGTNSFYWAVDKTVGWLDLVPNWGQLAPHESAIVTVSLTSEANSLGGGVYIDTITFIDITNDEEQTRGAVLTISAIPGFLEITPVEDFESSGEIGGPFTPSSKEYKLTNKGGSSIYWGAAKTADWLDLDSEFGSLDPCECTVVTVSLTSEVNSLGTGIYTDTLTFTDLTNAEEQTRGVTLTIKLHPVWISPGSFDVNTIEGLSPIETLTIGNNMEEDLNFMIRTRQVTPAEAGERIDSGKTAGKDGIYSLPVDHDFTVVGQAPYKPGELIVRFATKKDGRLPGTAERNQILSSVGGGTIKYDFKIVPGLNVVELPTWTTVEHALLTFNGMDGIVYAQPNYELKVLSTFPNDPRFDELWGMHNTGQTGGTFDADIDAPEAWDIATGSSEIVVAVIDTGVDYTHVDLAANMWVNEAEYNGSPGVDDDRNGYVDDIYGYDFCNNDGDPMDDHYHGTHCAGTIGAIGNNDEGVTGVCWNVKIMALKFLSSRGGGWTDDAIKCVEYSTLMGAKLSSNSWGGGGYNQGLKDAIDAAGAAGMLFLASAGNDGANNDEHPHYPSSYDCESLIAVMATDSDDRRSVHPGWASNYGLQSVDIGAPGSSILSCEPRDLYGIHSGTSMATPHVAGACALLWSTNPLMGNNEVKDIVLRTVDKILAGLCVSEGRLNLYKAVLETRAPWIQIEPDAGTIAPGESSDISVTFDAMELAPGTYQAEIVIISNEPGSPRIVPVTMIVKADDLQVSPPEGFESIGTEGGPFEPPCTVYTLTNNGEEPVNWTTFETKDWLEVIPYEGVLGPNETIDVNVCISAEANSLDPNIYTEMLVFQNTGSGSMKPRLMSLIVKPPDCFTESFSDIGNDVRGLTLTFSPDGSIAYYEACRGEFEGFPTDPNGGVYVPLWDDDFVEVALTGDVNVLFYGEWYDRFYIGSNGYITFGQGDVQFEPLLENHFDMPRISGLFTDLNPPNDECISYKQLDDRVVVTFEDVPVYGDKSVTNSFQVEMFFVDGTICITWLDIAPAASVVGLSRGRGLPPAFFEQSNLSEYPPCWPWGDFDRDYRVDMYDLAVFAHHWLEADCNIPRWCEETDLDFSRRVEMADFAIFADNWMVKEDWFLQPVSRWKFDEGGGTIAYDSVGNNHGTVYGATWTAGQIGGALSFDGLDDYVGVPDDYSLDLGTHDLSFAFWFRTTVCSVSYEHMFTKRSTTTGPSNRVWDGYSAYLNADGTVVAWFRHTYSKDEGVWVTSTTSYDDDNWHHLAGVYTRSANLELYVDGVPEGTPGDISYAEGKDIDLTQPLAIGCRVVYGRSNDLYFNGKIDEVRIYDRALSAEEIRELYLEGFGNKAFHPHPADGAAGVDPNVILVWSEGIGALSHDVYLGTDSNDVNDATPDSNEYMGNYGDSRYDPCGLEFETTYYWRVDEIGASTTTKGNVWRFMTGAEPIPGLISWWNFNEGEGTIAYDSVGNNHGIIHNAVWATGKIDGALSFDGDGDYVDCGDDISLDSINSVSLWLNPETKSGYHATFIGQYATNADRWAFCIYEAANRLFLFSDGSYLVNSDVDSVSPGNWYHAVMTWDGSTGKMYINGIQQTETTTTSFFNVINPEILSIGIHFYSSIPSTPYGFKGVIDEVQVYDRALSVGEIEQLYFHQGVLMDGP